MNSFLCKFSSDHSSTAPVSRFAPSGVWKRKNIPPRRLPTPKVKPRKSPPSTYTGEGAPRFRLPVATISVKPRSRLCRSNRQPRAQSQLSCVSPPRTAATTVSVSRAETADVSGLSRPLCTLWPRARVALYQEQPMGALKDLERCRQLMLGRSSGLVLAMLACEIASTEIQIALQHGLSTQEKKEWLTKVSSTHGAHPLY